MPLSLLGIGLLSARSEFDGIMDVLMKRYHQVIKKLCCSLALWFGLGVMAHANFPWETVKYNGVDYVTLRSVKDFYYFNKIRYGAVITMESPRSCDGGSSRYPAMPDEWCFVYSELSRH